MFLFSFAFPLLSARIKHNKWSSGFSFFYNFFQDILINLSNLLDITHIGFKLFSLGAYVPLRIERSSPCQQDIVLPVGAIQPRFQ